MTHITYLDEQFPVFPSTAYALTEEANGLLAVGGNLDSNTLISAYSKGIFPWYSPDDPLLWWSPSPRMTLSPQNVHYPRSLKKLARKSPFHITIDRAFSDVIGHCATTERHDQPGTWISSDMIAAYERLHTLGYAHSVEAWSENTLVGGLYGVTIGRAFFGESMFSLKSGASKIAFASLCEQLKHWQFQLIDCQIHSPLLASFGAEEITRKAFETKLAQATRFDTKTDWISHWTLSENGFDGS